MGKAQLFIEVDSGGAFVVGEQVKGVGLHRVRTGYHCIEQKLSGLQPARRRMSYGRYWVTGPLRRRLRLALQ